MNLDNGVDQQQKDFLAEIQAAMSSLDLEIKQKTLEIKDVYSTPSNFESHDKPNQEKYYYPDNPKITFHGKGVPKDSLAGQTINDNIKTINDNKIKLNTLYRIKQNLQHHPELSYELMAAKESSKIENTISFIFNLPLSEKGVSLRAKLFEDPKIEHDRECRREGLDPDFN